MKQGTNFNTTKLKLGPSTPSPCSDVKLTPVYHTGELKQYREPALHPHSVRLRHIQIITCMFLEHLKGQKTVHCTRLKNNQYITLQNILVPPPWKLLECTRVLVYCKLQHKVFKHKHLHITTVLEWSFKASFYHARFLIWFWCSCYVFETCWSLLRINYLKT